MSGNSVFTDRPRLNACFYRHLSMALKIDVSEVTAALDAVDVVLERLSIDGLLCTNALAGRTSR